MHVARVTDAVTDAGKAAAAAPLSGRSADGRPWEALPPEVAAALKPELPALADEIVAAVRVVARGGSLLFPSAIRALAAAHGPRGGPRREAPELTPREAEILHLVARGLNNSEIAAELYLGLQTVKTHVSSLLRKLGARDRAQAVIAAYESGFVTPA